MVNREDGPSVTDWDARGRGDAPIATRAIARIVLANSPKVPGYRCATAIIDWYARDISVVGRGAVGVRQSEGRLLLLTQLMLDANNKKWFVASLHAPHDFMAQYQAGFLQALDDEMAQWAAQLVRWPAHPDLLAEEEPWSLALAMGDRLASRPRAGWRGLFGR